MKFPQFQTARNPVQEQEVRFSGLDFRYGMTGALWDADGISHDKYPSITSRQPEETVETYTEPSRIFAYQNGFLVVDGNQAKWNGTTVFEVADPDKLMIAGINGKIVVFPDKIALDVSGSTPRTEHLECTCSLRNVEYTLRYNEYIQEESQYFDTIEIHQVEKPFSGLHVNDTISISGLRVGTTGMEIETVTIRYISADGTRIGFYSAALFGGYTDQEYPQTQTGTLLFRRTVPDLDTLCESNNRLWGTEGNVIRACGLGDPFNWNRYDQLSDDAWSVVVATDGDFTACAHYSSHIVFFKGNVLHKVYGSKPSNYQVITAYAPGVAPGGERTLATVGCVLYYCGKDGVYAYDGDVPTCISGQLAGRQIRPYFAVGTLQKYFLYADIGSGEEMLYYDTMHNVWGVDSKHWLVDAAYNGENRYDLYAEGKLVQCGSGREKVRWWVQLADFDESGSERKRYHKLTIRCRMGWHARLRVDIRTDQDIWREVFAAQGVHSDILYIPIYPTRCMRLGIRFRCEGDVTIESVTRQFTASSDR